jgi:hypothetical protein
MLMKEKDRESEEWKSKFNLMKDKHDDILENLAEANKCYLV